MTATPKHRWYQFSLKTLLVGITVLCIGPGGYVAYEQAKARRQKAAVETIVKLGGDVDFFPTVQSRSATMRQILGDESFGNVGYVSFVATQIADADVSHLTRLKNISHLNLSHTKLTDAGLVHLTGMQRLTNLNLDHTQVTDAGLVHLAVLKPLVFLSLDNTQVTDAGLEHISSLSKLDSLWLQNTQVTDAGIAELQKALPNCEIVR